MDNIMKKIIHIFIVIFITALIATTISLIILKYNIEGENNMPFELSKIMVVSSAEGIEKENNSDNKWNFNINQNNDIYIEIKKNKNYKEKEIIDEIIIDNLNIIKSPKKGVNKTYRPTNKEGIIFEKNEDFEVKESIVYIGSEESNIKNLNIANQGGIVLFRSSIENIGDYISDEDEVKHDGTILKKIAVEYEEIKYSIKFDISIKLKSEKIYTGTIELNLPAGDILTEGTSSYEKNNLKDIIFKRNLR